MEKIIDENKQGERLVLENKKENSRKLYIESYGCAMNFSDSEIVASILSNEGFNTTHILEEAFTSKGLLDVARFSPALYLGGDIYLTTLKDTMKHLDRHEYGGR